MLRNSAGDLTATSLFSSCSGFDSGFDFICFICLILNDKTLHFLSFLRYFATSPCCIIINVLRLSENLYQFSVRFISWHLLKIKSTTVSFSHVLQKKGKFSPKRFSCTVS